MTQSGKTNSLMQSRFAISMHKRHSNVCSVVALSFLVTISSAFAQETAIKQESLEDYNTRMQWFAEAKFGMFIHFGLYSQLGGVWKGKASSYYAEWIQSKPGIPDEEYVELVKTFNPSKFDAEFIVTTAKKAAYGTETCFVGS